MQRFKQFLSEAMDLNTEHEVAPESKPFVAYHQTSLENAKKIKRYGFNLHKATMGIVWFTTNLNALKDNSVGAQTRGAILKLAVDIKNPAGWKEYDDLLLAQLKRTFDGVILPNDDGTFDGFVFDPKKHLKILEIITDL
jgi:hypothetical protein